MNTTYFESRSISRARLQIRPLLLVAAWFWASAVIGCWEESVGAIPSDPEALREKLFEAVKYGTPLRCEQLVKAGAPINARDPLGWTPLHYAISRLRNPESQDRRSIELLIESAGADLGAITNDGTTTAWLATRYGATDVLDSLLRHGVDLEQLDDNGRTLLMEAAVSRQTEMAAHLIELGLDVDAIAPDGAGAITLAARFGAIGVLDLLLEHGAPIEHRDHRGMTLLMEAVDLRKLEMATHLIERGVDVDQPLPQGATALFFAVNKRVPAIVRLLIEHRADVDAVDERDGMTPLHWAARSGAPMVELLLEAGARRGLANREGATALDLARESGDSESIQLLNRNT